MPRNQSERRLSALAEYRAALEKISANRLGIKDPDFLKTWDALHEDDRYDLFFLPFRQRLPWIDIKLEGSLYCQRGASTP